MGERDKVIPIVRSYDMISFLLSLAVLLSATGDLEMKYTLSALYNLHI